MISKDISNYQSYDIFIHEKGQFWPRSGGSLKKYLFLFYGSSNYGSFSLVRSSKKIGFSAKDKSFQRPFPLDMSSFGQTDVVTVNPGTEVELRISTVNIENLKTGETNCIEDKTYSLTQCLKKYTLAKTQERSRKYH